MSAIDPAATQPEDAKAADGTKSGRESVGSKKKAPKKKKLSKKERLRLKREAEEEAQRRKEEEEKEEKERKQREIEENQRNKQKERLESEDAYIHQLRQQRTDEGKRQRSIQAQNEDWEIFKRCDHFIDVRSQSDVNTFITNWKEGEDIELPELFEHIHQAHTIIDQLVKMHQDAEVSKEKVVYDRCERQINELRDLIYEKIKTITVRHLVFSDKYAAAKNEVQVASQADGLSFAMWVNMSKNPRIKEIEFPELKMEISKVIALSSLAIRIIMTPTKPSNDKYLFLNRLLQCELLQLPTPPKRIGTMTLRQSPHQNSLVTLSYPLKNSSAEQTPLSFTIPVAEGVLTDYMQDATVVMLNKDNTVSTSQISKVSVDRENNTVSFTSTCVGTFALAIPKYSHFPLKFWEITSLSETSIEIYIQTQLVELAIVIDGEGKCSMESPFQFKGLTPVAAVEYLAERGINIVAPPGSIEGINAKTPELEDVLAQGLADTVTGFHVKWSKWNALVQSDRAMLLMKPQSTFVVEEEEEEINEADTEQAVEGQPEENTEAQPEEKEAQPKKQRMFCILAKANHMTEVKNTEREEECDTKPIDENNIHQHLFPMFMDRAPEDVQARVAKAPSFLCDATYYLLKNLRLFSMTQ